MGILSRVNAVFKAKANKVLDKIEDPRESIEIAYLEQVDVLKKVKRGVLEIATSKKRLEIQQAKLELNRNKLQEQAEEALRLDREDLAKLALERKKLLEVDTENIAQQQNELQQEQDKLAEVEHRLALDVDALKIKKEVIKAQYTAAESTTKVKEAMSGLTTGLGDVVDALQRAEEKTEAMKARVDAIDELQETGTLDALVTHKDEIERELDKLRDVSVDKELEVLKEKMNENRRA